jgi:hypothetical protein
VENQLFRVHSYFFDRESTFFHHKLSAASPPGEDRIGGSDSNAFTLENVRAIDFERVRSASLQCDAVFLIIIKNAAHK